MNAQNLQSSVECSGQLEPLVEYRNHQVGAHRDPDLSLHRVGTRSVEMLDAKVTFYPAEEQLDTPPCLVKHSDGHSWYFQVVGQKDEFLAGLRIVVSDLSQQGWECLSRFGQFGFPNMIAAQAGEAIHLIRVMSGELEVALCASHEESTCVCYQDKTIEIHVATIHEIEGSCFEQQTVEPSHIVLPRTCNANTGRNRSAQIDLGMKLDTPWFGGSPPTEKASATSRWLWSRARRSCCPNPGQDPRPHKAAWLSSSNSWRVPPIFANLSFRWHRREWILQSVR